VCVCVVQVIYIYIHIYTCIHICIYVYICIYLQVTLPVGKGAEALWTMLLEAANRMLEFQGWPGRYRMCSL
jgi:hypothetical protein